MAYQTGTAADPADLLDKLRVFAAANGFTINNFGDRTAGTAPRKALQLTKGGLSCSFLSDSVLTPVSSPGPFVGLYAHNAYVAGSGTEGQAGASAQQFCNDMGGPYQAYHFFSDGAGDNPYLYVVVETIAGTFKHLGAGILDALGVLTTGVFTFASRWNHEASPLRISDPESAYHSYPFDVYGTQELAPGSTQVRADSDTITPRWFKTSSGAFGTRINAAGVRGTSGPSDAGSQQKAMMYGPGRASASARTGRTTLVPCLLAVERSGTNSTIVGAPPNVRHVRLTYLDPGQTITLGTDVWKVFPVIRKNGTTGQVNSGLYGLAYKVN